MNWQQVREQYPHKWVLAETIEGHTENDRWCVDQLTVVDVFAEVSDALNLRKKLHKKAPARDYFVFHTDQKELTMKERYWLGVRTAA
uniref:Uncharacterized protein n=1 Tax=Candidatus Kentrum sp. MB TaxID=2138164 RepID=A0A450X4J3_9GAMM|nr:MAG: hypothetical protein BECKMB1821G_GA0114241_100737 [Candidatus Kentron sp. MB]VFK30524.1 MAG: hypothetical protein BECKMB1821I_GA0114274_101619 [Candidatus Kentron sp. MB]VFK75286.1 MAG: hypothetical protein BECKMB1821H_GA0114242_101918 [Candidatus Kentron sp. MB]